MISLTIPNHQQLEFLYNLGEDARSGDEKAGKELLKYRHLNVRVGGYQVPFIALTKAHQENYLKRAIQPYLKWSNTFPSCRPRIVIV